jgi:hypothetical protein
MPLYIVATADGITKTDKDAAYKLAQKIKDAGGEAFVYDEDYYRQNIHYKKDLSK